jgi:hypothetical protein
MLRNVLRRVPMFWFLRTRLLEACSAENCQKGSDGRPQEPTATLCNSSRKRPGTVPRVRRFLFQPFMLFVFKIAFFADI